jgi:hypothetical protein
MLGTTSPSRPPHRLAVRLVHPPLFCFAASLSSSSSSSRSRRVHPPSQAEQRNLWPCPPVMSGNGKVVAFRFQTRLYIVDATQRWEATKKDNGGGAKTVRQGHPTCFFATLQRKNELGAACGRRRALLYPFSMCTSRFATRQLLHPKSLVPVVLCARPAVAETACTRTC